MSKVPDLEIHWVDIEVPIASEYNPRKITPKKKKELMESIQKYGLRDPLKINTYKGRENVLISGHQRLSVAKDLGHKKVPVTYEHLPIDQEKEMNLRWNKNAGVFDMEKVITLADREKLFEIGFLDSELPKLLSDFEQKFEDIDTDSPVYPIAPKFSEHYDFIMILTETEIDYMWLKNTFEIENKQSYKSQQVGECRVIKVKEFMKLYEKWSAKS